MQKRKLGYSDIELTTVGLGTWAIGGGTYVFGWGDQDDADSIATINRALDLGVNWLDTAAGYGTGHSEEVVGKAVAGRRDEVFIATKCGIAWDADCWNIRQALDAGTIRTEAEDSLRRLNVEVIDLFQIHWPAPDEQIEGAWGVIADLIKEGKVRYGGVSNFSVEQMKRAQAIHPIASLQPPYSMLNRGVENELLPFCAENQIGVIVYSPMERGMLTGKMTRERVAAMPENDHRGRAEQFQDPLLSANLDLVEGLRPIAERNGKTLAQLAIAWVLRRPELTAAIVGARRPDQLDGPVAAMDWDLSEEDIGAVEDLLSKRQMALDQA